MSTRSELIKKILNIEWDMFQNVPALQRTECQESEGGFKLIRGSVFETWSETTLDSYYNDLIKTKNKGGNIMTLKYARMDNLIPALSSNHLIDKIVDIESKWQIELSNKFPHLIIYGQTSGYCGAPGTTSCVTFEVYLRCELETYSDSTLEAYHQNLSKALSEGRNIEEEIYTRIMQKMGYSSLEDVEQKVRESADA